MRDFISSVYIRICAEYGKKRAAGKYIPSFNPYRGNNITVFDGEFKTRQTSMMGPFCEDSNRLSNFYSFREFHHRRLTEF